MLIRPFLASLLFIFQLVLLAAFPKVTFAQKKWETSSAELAIAKKLAEDYKDQDIGLLKKEIKLEFFFDKKSETVKARETIKESLISLKESATMTASQFFNSKSQVTVARGTLKGGYPISYSNISTTKRDFYKSRDIFYSDAKVCWFNLRFTEFGQIYKTTFVRIIDDIQYLSPQYLSSGRPEVESTAEIIVPSWLKVKLRKFHHPKWKIKEVVQPDSKGKSTVYTYSGKNIPPMEKKEYSPGPSYVFPHILILPQSYAYKEKKGNFFTSYQDMYKWYESLIAKVNNNPKLTAAKVAEITKGASTDEEKIKKIFYWVQDHVRYIAFEDGIAGFKPDDSQNVYEKGYGDCKGMANLCKQMLITAGYDARLCWLGTRRLAYDYSIPSLIVDNHMICAVMQDGKPTFLDPTEKYSDFGSYAERIQGREVLIENKGEPLKTKIPVQPFVKNREEVFQSLKIEGSHLVGNSKHIYHNQSKSNFLQGINSIKSTRMEEAMEGYYSRGKNEYLVSDLKFSDLSARDAETTVKYHLEFRNAAQAFENEIYIDYDFYKDYADLDFEDRKSDFMFPLKSLEKTIIEIEIPDQMKVKHLPENLTVEKEEFTIILEFAQEGNKIIYTKTISFPNARVSQANFEAFEHTITHLKDIYNDNIVLTK